MKWPLCRTKSARYYCFPANTFNTLHLLGHHDVSSRSSIDLFETVLFNYGGFRTKKPNASQCRGISWTDIWGSTRLICGILFQLVVSCCLQIVSFVFPPFRVPSGVISYTHSLLHSFQALDLNVLTPTGVNDENDGVYSPKSDMI